MSTWISKARGRDKAGGTSAPRPLARRSFVWPILLLTLAAACSGLNDAAVTRISVLNGSVTLAAPRGYCVDATALRESPRGAFVLFGSCAALAPGPFAPAPTPLGVLSAAASVPRTGAVSPLAGAAHRMAAYVNSPAGRRALSRGRDPGSVQILRTRFEDGVFYIRLRDTSTTIGPRVAPEYWRAILDINQRMITLSVLALDDAPIDEATGGTVIRDFAARVRAANRR